jgi:hypothetical protein
LLEGGCFTFCYPVSRTLQFLTQSLFTQKSEQSQFTSLKAIAKGLGIDPGQIRVDSVLCHGSVGYYRERDGRKNKPLAVAAGS